MANGNHADLLERYWRALQSGAHEEAQHLRIALQQEYSTLEKSLDLLDELIDAKAFIYENDPKSEEPASEN